MASRCRLGDCGIARAGDGSCLRVRRPSPARSSRVPRSPSEGSRPALRLRPRPCLASASRACSSAPGSRASRPRRPSWDRPATSGGSRRAWISCARAISSLPQAGFMFFFSSSETAARIASTACSRHGTRPTRSASAAAKPSVCLANFSLRLGDPLGDAVVDFRFAALDEGVLQIGPLLADEHFEGDRLARLAVDAACRRRTSACTAECR